MTASREHAQSPATMVEEWFNAQGARTYGPGPAPAKVGLRVPSITIAILLVSSQHGFTPLPCRRL